MKKILLPLFLLVAVYQVAMAQPANRIITNPDADTTTYIHQSPTLLSKSIWRLRALGIGIEHERMIDKKASLVAMAKLSSFHSYRLVGFPPSLVIGYTVNPSVSVSGRYCYDLEKRLREGHFIRSNSGNYLMARSVFI